MPANTAVGNFAVDGVFGFGTPSPFEKSVFAADSSRPAMTKNTWSVLEQADSSQPSPPQKHLEDPVASFGNSVPFSPSQQNRDTYKEPIGFSMLGKPEAQASVSIPNFKFIPPQWVYEDPSGRIQGPFTSEQMHGWYKEGYFPPALPIKCVGDPQFISLVRFVEKYGGQSPFLDSLRDQEALEREYFYQEVIRQQQQQSVAGFRNPLGIDSSRVPVGIPMFGEPQISQFNAIDSDIRPPFGNQMRFNTPTNPPNLGGFGQPQQRNDQQGMLQFMAQHQYEDPVPKSQPEVPVRVPSPQRQPSPISENRFRNPSRSPTFKTTSPKSHVQDEFIPESVQPSAPESVKEKPLKSKKKKETNSKKKTSEESINVEEPDNTMSASSESKPAPWANIKKQDSSAALKAIQATELKETEARKSREEKEARVRILAEAQALAQKEIASQQSGLPTNSQWANAGAPKKKKTLQEIMEDEAIEKQLLEKQNPSINAPKGYANTVSGNTLSSKPVNFAKVVSSKPAPVPKEEEAGWKNVAKKQQKPLSPQVISPAKSTPPVKLNYNGSVSASATNAEGRSPVLLQKPTSTNQTLQWSRNILRNVGRETSLNSTFI
jgi:hypothetical protein